MDYLGRLSAEFRKRRKERKKGRKKEKETI